MNPIKVALHMQTPDTISVEEIADFVERAVYGLIKTEPVPSRFKDITDVQVREIALLFGDR